MGIRLCVRVCVCARAQATKARLVLASCLAYAGRTRFSVTRLGVLRPGAYNVVLRMAPCWATSALCGSYADASRYAHLSATIGRPNGWPTLSKAKSGQLLLISISQHYLHHFKI
eukprot:1158474-Pelagomonas_calceolata.AAC.4